MGPVQVLVVGFDRPNFSGEVLAEFDRLREAGIVRLVDLAVLSRTNEGDLQTSTAVESLPGRGQVALALLGRGSGVAEGEVAEEAVAADGGETWSLADVVPSGSTAAVALIEHVWAGPLVDAIRRAGGQPLQEAWLAPEDLEILERLVASRSADAPLSAESG